MSMSKFRNIINEQSADNTKAKSKEITDSSKSKSSNSVQGIKFLNFPLFNAGTAKESPPCSALRNPCPAQRSCATEHVCLQFRKRTTDINTTNDTNSIHSSRKP